jgi:hypothetical protein
VQAKGAATSPHSFNTRWDIALVRADALQASLLFVYRRAFRTWVRARRSTGTLGSIDTTGPRLMTAEMRSFFEEYSHAYDAFDVVRIAEFVSQPLLTVRDGAVTVHDTPEKLHAFFRALLEWFKGIQHGTTSITQLDVHPLGQKSAFVNVVWRSTRADRSTFTEWPTAYHLIHDGERWKILVIVLRYEPARETPCS